MQLKFRFFVFLSLFVFHVHLQADHPIFALFTHPRATGTAFEKVMGTYDDILVLHAPYLDPYLIRKYGCDHSFTRALPNPSLTFEDVTKKLFLMAKHSPVFFKESGYLLVEYLKGHPEFYKNSQVKTAFLVRDPAKSILSYYRKMPAVMTQLLDIGNYGSFLSFLKSSKKKYPLSLIRINF